LKLELRIDNTTRTYSVHVTKSDHIFQRFLTEFCMAITSVYRIKSSPSSFCASQTLMLHDSVRGWLTFNHSNIHEFDQAVIDHAATNWVTSYLIPFEGLIHVRQYNVSFAHRATNILEMTSDTRTNYDSHIPRKSCSPPNSGRHCQP
jgi:hypothetical protein